MPRSEIPSVACVCTRRVFLFSFFFLSAFDLSRLSACAARRANKLQSYDTRLGGGGVVVGGAGIKTAIYVSGHVSLGKGWGGAVKFRLPRCRPLLLLSFQRAYF